MDKKSYKQQSTQTVQLTNVYNSKKLFTIFVMLNYNRKEILVYSFDGFLSWNIFSNSD